MAKKQEQVNEIVENELIVINEEDIISGKDLKETDVIDVNTSEVIMEKKNKEEEANEKKNNTVELIVLIAFTDKYTDESYIVNDVISVNEERAKELLADSRRLVKKKD